MTMTTMTTHHDGDDIDDFPDVEEVGMRDGKKGGKPLAYWNPIVAETT